MDVCFEGVRFRRGPRLILDVPALTLRSGGVTALLGPNGSGKSTLLHLAAALERPHEGAVYLGGRRAARDRHTHEAIAYAFQEPVFLAGTVRANLNLALRLRRLATDERHTRIRDVSAALAIEHLLDRDARRLSGGEAQRASLARALALRAPVTLLDEPLSGLDAPVRLQLLQELPALLAAFAATTVFVTHDRDEALRLADHLVLLIDGRVRAAGDKRAVFQSPPDPVTAAFLGYTVLSTDTGPVGIAPGALAVGEGEVTFEMLVESVADLGFSREATGFVGNQRVSARVFGEAPASGWHTAVSAPRQAVVRWPA